MISIACFVIALCILWEKTAEETVSIQQKESKVVQTAPSHITEKIMTK